MVASSLSDIEPELVFILWKSRPNLDRVPSVAFQAQAQIMKIPLGDAAGLLAAGEDILNFANEFGFLGVERTAQRSHQAAGYAQ